MLILENPAVGQFFGALDRHDDVGQQSYPGLKLSVQRRAATGVSLNGNYTLSRCEGDTGSAFAFAQFSAGYTNPDDPSFDRGNCTQNRTHIANLTVGARDAASSPTPRCAPLASSWSVSGIVNARSGSWLTVTTSHGRRGQRHRRPAGQPVSRRLWRQDA